MIIAGGVYLSGYLGLIYSLSAMDSLILGALISAVDPVATLAIFQALDVPSTLYMLVFGESVTGVEAGALADTDVWAQSPVCLDRVVATVWCLLSHTALLASADQMSHTSCRCSTMLSL